MPTLSFTQSTFDMLHLPGQHDNEQFCIDIAQYVKNLLHSRVHDAIRRRTQWIAIRRGKWRHADRDDARDCYFDETACKGTRAMATRRVGDTQGKDRWDGGAVTTEGSGGKANSRVVKTREIYFRGVGVGLEYLHRISIVYTFIPRLISSE